MGKKKKAKAPRRKSPKVPPKIKLAQQRNRYLHYLQQIARATGTLAAYHLIPKNEHKILAFMRIRPFQIDAEPGQNIPPSLLSIARRFIAEYSKVIIFTTLPDGTEVTLYDYITVVLSFYTYLKTLQGNEYKTAAEVKKGFAPFRELVDKTSHPSLRFFDLGNNVCYFFTHINQCFYWFNYTTVSKDIPVPSFAYGLTLQRAEAEKIEIDLDGKKRPVYRVGWAFTSIGISWATIKAAEFKIQGSFSDMPLNVYIQSHALLRLKERLDRVAETITHFCLFESLINLHIIRMEDGATLVEYRLYNIKVGYLVVDLVEGQVVIRTFLFLTNSGTPEGEKLKQMLGLQMLERKYLEIDKLSTFVLSDLIDHPALVEIFTNAGCGSLFEFAAQGVKVETKLQQAQRIMDYLQLQEEFED